MVEACFTPEYGIETISRNFQMHAMHYHDAYEIYFLEAGTRTYFVEDKFFSVSAGDVVLIPPGTLHRTGGEYCSRTLVQFTRDYLERIYTADVADNLLKCFAHIKIVPTQEQLTYCKQLLKRMAEAEWLEFGLVLGSLLKELGQYANAELPGGLVGNVVAYMNENYPTIRNIDQIAGHFYVSKCHLCRVFKESMGITLIDYLNQIKLKNAKQLLTLSDRSISQVAELCGYNSVSYFSNIFKTAVGMSPSEYRSNTRRKT